MPDAHPPISLRAATPEDAFSLAALSLEVWLGTYLKEGISEVFARFALDTFTPESFSAQIERKDISILVSDNAQGIDGFIRTDFAATPALPACSNTEIAIFYVQPRHHGKGIGRALFSAALGNCRAQGASSVWLTTNCENTPAKRFYLAQGFEIIGQTDYIIDGQGYANDVFQMDLS